jgi:hypothetical protein
MRTGYLLAQQLKQLKTPNNNDRLARALWVATAVGYKVPLNPAVNFDAAYEQHAKPFLKLLNEVNENIALDTKLALSCFRTTLRTRYELMNGTGDPMLIQAALNSHYAELSGTPEKKGMSDWLTSRHEFAASQQAASTLLDEHFAEVE